MVKHKSFRALGVVKHAGAHHAHGRRFGIVVSRFNEYLTKHLLEGALETLISHGAREKDIRVVHVPGAFEIPIALRKLLNETKLDAAMALAVVIRGQTKHFDQVAAEAAKGVRQIALASNVPVVLGTIFADSEIQAIERAGLKHMNKGREWALSAIEMADLMKQNFGKKK